MKSSTANLHIVLLEPEIPGNTGNVGRTCIGLGATLHLVGKLGFSLDEKHLKRAGLDYWPKIHLERHDSWEAFLATAGEAPMFFFSARATNSLWQTTFPKPVYLVFGSESHGFPKAFYERYADRLVKIPISDDIRSLNLATAVGAAAFEVARQFDTLK